jgi:hypothetical protein
MQGDKWWCCVQRARTQGGDGEFAKKEEFGRWEEDSLFYTNPRSPTRLLLCVIRTSLAPIHVQQTASSAAGPAFLVLLRALVGSRGLLVHASVG